MHFDLDNNKIFDGSVDRKITSELLAWNLYHIERCYYF